MSAVAAWCESRADRSPTARARAWSYACAPPFNSRSAVAGEASAAMPHFKGGRMPCSSGRLDASLLRSPPPDEDQDAQLAAAIVVRGGTETSTRGPSGCEDEAHWQRNQELTGGRVRQPAAIARLGATPGVCGWSTKRCSNSAPPRAVPEGRRAQPSPRYAHPRTTAAPEHTGRPRANARSWRRADGRSLLHAGRVPGRVEDRVCRLRAHAVK